MRKIQVEITAGESPVVTVDGVELPTTSAARILVQRGEIPAVQVEFRGDVELSAFDGVVQLLDGADATAILVQAVDQLDPAGLEQAILSELGGLSGANTTGEAAVAALKKWAAGHGSA